MGIRNSGILSVIQDGGASNSVGLSISDTGLVNSSAGDIIGIYIRKVRNLYGMWFSLNGTAMENTPAATATAAADISFGADLELVPAVHYTNAGTKEAKTNFGQLLNFAKMPTSFNSDSDGYWRHAPVSGFKALNQDNLDNTSDKITAWAWIKNRDQNDSHMLIDRVRGTGKDMHSNDTPAEVTNTNTVQRFLQRGVQIGNDVEVNTANESYVLWQWLVGASATTGSTTSPAGSIASTSIVAAADHFSIISYTGNATGGATIGHGLSAAPEMIWIKERDNANGWIVGSDVVGYTKILRLDTTDAETTDSGAFNDTAPSATLITLGSNNGTNRSSGKMICYAFRSVPGVCKIGTYEGNASADGPYIFTGFAPKWLFIKRYDSTTDAHWWILDTVRDNDGNPTNHLLRLNANNVEGANNSSLNTDFLSDGFKPRSTYTGINASSGTYLYMAMADIGGNGTLPPIYGKRK